MILSALPIFCLHQAPKCPTVASRYSKGDEYELDHIRDPVRLRRLDLVA